MNPSIEVPKARLVVTLGGGGVGKTTLSAALALGFAELGLRSVVLTVDPAKRLATILGLESLSIEPRRVFEAPGGGSADALWLDSRSALESLVRQYAPQTADRVLGNRLFKVLQGQLGGIEEYLGVERILAVGRGGDFDVCILDTPPSRHALDFLDSPGHLLRFFDESVLRFFVESERLTEKGFFSRLIDTGRGQALELFRGFLGKSFLGELSTLLTEFRPVYEVLKRRAREIEMWTGSDRTEFLLVATPETYPVEEAVFLSREIETRGLPGRRVLALNKCLPADPLPPGALEAALGAETASALRARQANEARLRAEIAARLGDAPRAELARASGHELDLNRLTRLGRQLIQEGRFL